MKRAICLLVFSILIFPIISAVDFEMKDEFKQGETLFAKVSGNFLQPILKNNIHFYRGHVKIPMAYDVTKIDNKFYIYAQLLGKQPTNYSLAIKDTRYMTGAETSQEDIVQNFTITNETADFTVDPGFIITADSFSIEVQNLQDSEITIEARIKNEESEPLFDILFGDDKSQRPPIDLISGETEKIYFNIDNVTSSVVELVEIKTDDLTYEIPIYVIVEEGEENDTGQLDFVEGELDISLSTDFIATRIIRLENTGDQTIEDITFSLSDRLKPFINLSVEEISELEGEEEFRLELIIIAEDNEKTITGQLTANSGDLYAYLPIYLNFVKDFVPEKDDENTTYTTTKTCEEINGTICESNQECDGESVYAEDGNCCRGTCVKIETSSRGKWLGWIIIIALIIAIFWFFKTKYRGARRGVPF